MPAWWRRKSKSSIDKRDQDGVSVVAKVNSFHGSSVAFDSEADPKTRHPLPCPVFGSHRSSADMVSGSPQSSSSAGSHEGSPDRGNFRYPGAESPWRGRIEIPDLTKQLPVVDDRRYVFEWAAADNERMGSGNVSPRRGGQANAFNIFACGIAQMNQRVSCDAMNSPGLRNPGPGSRLYGVCQSPFNLRAPNALDGTLGKLDDLKSPRHPLPLPPASPISPSSPSKESKWKKGKPLGRGTFGRVFVGFNSDSGQMCAIKEVEAVADDPNSKECLQQLNQEINLLSRLSHPNIVQYLGSELNDDTLAVYLEYISGGSLHKLVQDYGPLKEPVIRSYVRQILLGLSYLHGRNCVHRDIKGANILVGPNGDIKLADFGMAKHISSCTSLRSFRGSPFWMAPEVVMNSNGYSQAVDIWSLGCTIIEMATSKPPWIQYTGVQAIFKLGNSKEIPDIPDNISNDAKSFLKLCLQRDPLARPTAAQLMEHPFVRRSGKMNDSKPVSKKDAHPSSDRTQLPTVSTPRSTRVSPPLPDRDFKIRTTAESSPFPPNQSMGMGPNLSLPVSPCSSPLRQTKQPNSCYPSPRRHAYSGDMVNCAMSKYTLHPVSPNGRYIDNWPEFNGTTQWASPWRSQLQPIPRMGGSRA